MTTNVLAAIGDTFAADVKAFRSAAVSAENKATPFARSALASLIAGTRTVSGMESNIIFAFGNPKSPKSGKPVAKLSGLRDFVGGDAVRKTADTIFNIFSNIDADKPRVVGEGDTAVTVGAGAIRAIVTAFVLNEADAPKSLKALSDAVRGALREHAKAEAEAEGVNNEDAVADNAEAETSDAPATVSLIDRINAVTVAIGAATDDDLNDAYSAMEMLIAAYDARVNAATDAAEPMAEAA